jgi:nitroimidazol reductase NimA-like FMN-containing flavoprotein (pyridoxamine 5'-phosphate oxidase superfamily)
LTSLTPTPRSTACRRTQRASHDVDAIAAVLDEALVAHVGFVQDGQPFVIPTNAWRVGEALYFHCARNGRMAEVMGSGAPLCVTVTLMDGLVLARSLMHHSMNYRSVMLFGVAEEVVEAEEKLPLLTALVEHMHPGRAALVREPDDKELAVTAVFRLPITEGSAKARTGGPVDRPDDMSRDVPAGVVPLTVLRGDLVP